jgi:hypothetical protein
METCQLPGGAILRVHGGMQIAGTPADFERFLRDVRILRDWMVEQTGCELKAPLHVNCGTRGLVDNE